jgi:hypothetical protein
VLSEACRNNLEGEAQEEVAERRIVSTRGKWLLIKTTGVVVETAPVVGKGSIQST